jgi:hypothetical protein
MGADMRYVQFFFWLTSRCLCFDQQDSKIFSRALVVRDTLIRYTAMPRSDGIIPTRVKSMVHDG